MAFIGSETQYLQLSVAVLFSLSPPLSKHQYFCLINMRNVYPTFHNIPWQAPSYVFGPASPFPFSDAPLLVLELISPCTHSLLVRREGGRTFHLAQLYRIVRSRTVYLFVHFFHFLPAYAWLSTNSSNHPYLYVK